jgi:quercetin dioxygenase-like cupin family protein
MIADDLQIQYAETLDAMAAAPGHHEVLFENDQVRVLDSRVSAGERTPVHTHRWPSVLYIIGTSDFVRYDDKGKVLFDSRSAGQMPEVGQAIWSPPLPPHSVENIGNSQIRVISVEIKDQGKD